VIKHAATDSCQLSVAYQDDALTLEITDAGSAGPPAPARQTGVRSRAWHHRNAGAGRHVWWAVPGRATSGRGFRVIAVFR